MSEGAVSAETRRARPGAGRWSRPRVPGGVLAGGVLAGGALVCGGLAAVLTVAAGWPYWQDEPALAAVNALVSAAFVISGVLLAGAAALRRTGGLIVAAGLCWAHTFLLCRESGPLPAVGLFANALFFATFGWGVLLYPDGRTTGRLDRVAGVLTTIAFGPLAALSIVVSEPEWNGFAATTSWPSLWANARLFSAISDAYLVVNPVLAVLFVVLLARRWGRLYGLERSVVAPALLVLGVVLVALAVLSPTLANHESGHVAAGVAQQGATLAALPLAMLVCELWRAVAVATSADRMLRLGGGPATVDVVRDALREALRDDTVEVYFWLAGEQRFVDIEGRPARPESPPGPGLPGSPAWPGSPSWPGSSVSPAWPGSAAPPAATVAPASSGPRRARGQVWSQPVITPSGEPFAMVTGRSSVLRRHAAFTGAALRTARLALQNAHLQVAIQAQLVETRAAQRRVGEAEAAERNRIARDLHDGVQQRLLALAMMVSVAEWSADDPAATASLFGDIRAGLLAANDEVRAIARGLDPEVLRTEGLVGAVRLAVGRLGLPADVDIGLARPGPFGDLAERTVYFAVSESLANVAKHARATRVRVRLAEETGHLVAEVLDDGCGGAVEGGSGGLAGLRDRAEAAGGSLDLISPPGGGTAVRVAVPTSAAT